MMHKYENVENISYLSWKKIVRKTIQEDKNVPVKLNPFVSFPSIATEPSISHLPTIIQVPHIIVRSKTVDPASKPIPTET